MQSNIFNKEPFIGSPEWGESKYWSYKDLRVHFRVTGNESNPPIVLIHGFGASSDHWRNNAEIFAHDVNTLKLSNLLLRSNRAGARIKIILFELAGIIISLKMYLSASAKDCNNPKGPTTFGPFLNCINPIILLSAKVK